MKKLLKTIASVLLIIAILSSFTAVSSAFSFSKVIWKNPNGITSVTTEYKGELKEGKNNITCFSNNDIGGNCYSFTAPEEGYYILNNFYSFFTSRKTRGNIVTDYVIRTFPADILTVFDYAVYMNKGETQYFGFFCNDGGRRILDCTINVEYYGKITDVTLKDNKCDAVHDIYLGDELSTVFFSSDAVLSFSTGKKLKSSYIKCKLDSITGGKHTVFADIFDGHGFDITIDIVNIMELIDKIELPEYDYPRAFISYGQYGTEYSQVSLPEYLNVYMTNGKKYKAVLNEENQYYFDFNYAGTKYAFWGDFEIDSQGNSLWNVYIGNGFNSFAEDIYFIESFEVNTLVYDSPKDVITLAEKAFRNFIGFLQSLKSSSDYSASELFVIYIKAQAEEIREFKNYEMMVVRSKLGK